MKLLINDDDDGCESCEIEEEQQVFDDNFEQLERMLEDLRCSNT